MFLCIGAPCFLIAINGATQNPKMDMLRLPNKATTERGRRLVADIMVDKVASAEDLSGSK